MFQHWTSVAILGAAFGAALAALTASADPLSASRALNNNAPSDSGADHHAQVAMDAAGHVVVVWTSTNTPVGGSGNDADVMFAYSDDNGRTFSDPQPIAAYELSDSTADREPTVTTDRNGVFLVAWRSNTPAFSSGGEGDLFFARSVDFGHHFSGPVFLNSDATTDSAVEASPRLSSDGAGTWVAVWSARGAFGADADILYARSTDNGQSFSAPQAIHANAATDSGDDLRPAVLSNEAGTFIVAWDSRENINGKGIDADLVYERSLDGGQTWSAIGLLNSNGLFDTGDDVSVDLAADGNGVWVAVWHSFEPLPWGPDADILSVRSLTDGTNWSAPAAVYSFELIELGGDFEPRVTTDRQGIWTVVWSREDSIPGGTASDTDILQATSYTNGTYWVGPELINLSELRDTGDDFSPDIATSRAGSWVVVWHSNDTLGGTIGPDFDVLIASAVCGDGIMQLREECDDGNVVGGDCCSPTCTIEPAGTLCRAQAGICDSAETCNGVDPSCPIDAFQPVTTLCRASSGACNAADYCTGLAADCPADIPLPLGTSCRPAVSVCDRPESCDGFGDACPPDLVQPAGQSCRAQNGVCDVAEQCDGVAATCPVDRFAAAGTECRAAAGACDVAESCTGAARTCPADRFAAAGVSCRASRGVCDFAEACSGSSAVCPADAYRADGSPCSNGVVCDGSEVCLTGTCGTGGGLACDDGDYCTVEFCVEPGGCGRVSIPDCCHAATDCDDHDACTDDACDMSGSCTHSARAGCCLGDGDCDDHNSCTADHCSAPGGSCVFAGITGCCNADADCSSESSCDALSCDLNAHRCVATPAPGCCTSAADCNDGNSCTTDACDTQTGRCEHSGSPGCCVSDGDCADGDRCTSDACVAGACVHGAISGCCQDSSECNDNDTCTSDRCDVRTNRCTTAALLGCCHDDSDCGGAPVCSIARCDTAQSRCVNEPVANCCSADEGCDDRDPCTIDSCMGGACGHARIVGCVPPSYDGGVVDGGGSDGGSAGDGGGPGPDGGTSAPDATAPDADAVLDGGAGADATVEAPDGGDAAVVVGPDAAAGPDAAVDGKDGGSASVDGGTPDSGTGGNILETLPDDDDCQCSATGAADRGPPWALALGGVALLGLRRRRRLGVAAVLAVAMLSFGLSRPAHADPEPGFNMLELGLSGGAFVPSREHELYDWKVAHFSPLAALGPDISLRLAYFPVAFFGAEVEGNYMPARTALGRAANVYTFRGHGVLQIPGQLTPFLLVGGGMLGVASASDALGNDTDRAFHWGAGVKYYLNDTFSIRADFRHIFSAAYGHESGNTSHFEGMLGFSMVLFKGEETKLIEPEQSPIRIVEAAKEPEPEPVPPPAPVETHAEIAIAAQAVEAVLNRVHFEWGSSELRSRDFAFLDEAVSLLEAHPALHVQVIGHTDSTGPHAYNLKLSDRRAEAVRAYLVGHGVAEVRVQTLGLGPDAPAASNTTAQGRAINRRIEFNVVDASEVKIRMLEPLGPSDPADPNESRLTSTPDDVLLR
ncbi:MAG: OmpA family protein [Myxococcota bacterium]